MQGAKLSTDCAISLSSILKSCPQCSCVCPVLLCWAVPGSPAQPLQLLWVQTLLPQPSLCPRHRLCCFLLRSPSGSAAFELRWFVPEPSPLAGDHGDATQATALGSAPPSPHPAFLGFTCRGSKITGTVALFGWVLCLFPFPLPLSGTEAAAAAAEPAPLSGRGGRRRGSRCRCVRGGQEGGAWGAGLLQRAPPGRGRGRRLARGRAGGCGERAQAARLVWGAGRGKESPAGQAESGGLGAAEGGPRREAGTGSRGWRMPCSDLPWPRPGPPARRAALPASLGVSEAAAEGASCRSGGCLVPLPGDAHPAAS